MSKLALLGVVAAATWFGTGLGNASILGGPLDRAPWCLRYDIGSGVVQENCRLPTFEACNYERAFWGSTAFCSPNPAFSGYRSDEDRPRARPRKKQRRHYR